MSEIKVDTEKLACGLKKAVGNSGYIFDAIPERWMLRGTPCGLVSSAIHEYCLLQDLPSRLVINKPKLDMDPKMEHVVPLVGDTDPTVVDASYSQFLGYVGLNWGYERYGGAHSFPVEEIVDFRVSETDIFIDWLTIVATEFQKRNTHPKNDWDMDMGGGLLSIAPESVIRQTFAAIYNPSGFEPWERPDYVVDDGKKAAAFIPRDSIIL